MRPYGQVKYKMLNKEVGDPRQKVLRKENIGFLQMCLFCNSTEINSYYGNCHITGGTGSKEDAVYLQLAERLLVVLETFCLLM